MNLNVDEKKVTGGSFEPGSSPLKPIVRINMTQGVSKYRKKPIVVEAIQYHREDNINLVQNFFGDRNGKDLIYDANVNDYYIKTLEGNMYIQPGDFIIKGVKGEFYPCKPDIFELTYEELGEILN